MCKSNAVICFAKGFLEVYNVNLLITVPSTLERMSLDSLFSDTMKKMNVLISCGEPFQIELMSKFTKFKNLEVYNFYGSTEVAPWIFFHKCSNITEKKYNNLRFVPIGNLIEGNEMYIKDNGELFVRGVQITPGYFGEKDGSHLKRINGDCKIGSGTFVGSGSVLLNNLKIKKNSFIKMGTIVKKNKIWKKFVLLLDQEQSMDC